MNQNVVILSCPYSGSSLISEIVILSGYPTMDVRTHFESRPLIHLNDKILQRDIDGNIISSISLFLEDLNKNFPKRWSLKDPQLALTISDLACYLPENVCYIVNFRDPSSVVEHIMDIRGKFRKDLSVNEAKQSAENEWLEKTQSILNFVKKNDGSKFYFINYEDLIAKDLGVQHSLSNFLGYDANFEMIEPKKNRRRGIEISNELSLLYEIMLTHSSESKVKYSGNKQYVKSTRVFKKINFHQFHFRFKVKRKLESFLSGHAKDNYWVRP